ncbi:MAG TPA: response regulator transcription factor [Verrucomicrobiae bacterium]|nr:response regulator transcription factor [Verrucomicrobiae bacterium]
MRTFEAATIKGLAQRTKYDMPEAKNRTKSGKTRILIVDDHAIVRFGIGQVINKEPDLLVCGEEENASRALDAIAALKPDLVIADISLKDSSGLELMRNIKAQYPRLPVLVVSGHDESIYAEIAFRAGALGYLMKEEALEKILTAIRRVLSGTVYVSDALAAKLLQQQIRGQSTTIQESPVKNLSDREMEVFRLIGQWKKTRDIAAELHLSIKTIEYYREQIKRKLNLKDAAELTQYATSWVQREIPT